jgi:hypothetical protein
MPNRSSKFGGQQTICMTPCVITQKGYTEIRVPSVDGNGRWYLREIRVWGGTRVDLGRDSA